MKIAIVGPQLTDFNFDTVRLYVCVHVISTLYFDSQCVLNKMLYSVYMKVQFLLSWCLVKELSPLARSIHLEHGKYMYYTFDYYSRVILTFLC